MDKVLTGQPEIPWRKHLKHWLAVYKNCSKNETQTTRIPKNKKRGKTKIETRECQWNGRVLEKNEKKGNVDFVSIGLKFVDRRVIFSLRARVPVAREMRAITHFCRKNLKREIPRFFSRKSKPNWKMHCWSFCKRCWFRLTRIGKQEFSSNRRNRSENH